jgi:6-phosphogluconate dehydrogenase
MADKAHIGIIGLGVMGANFARNLSGKGIRTAVYNRTKEVTDKFIMEHGNNNIVSAYSIKDLADHLEKPRKIILLVPSGDAVDSVIESLLPGLEKEDIILDLGNSFYEDTQKRFESLKEKGIRFMGCGISGGEKGALEGPCLMPGGEKTSWENIKPTFEKAAAKDSNGNPCVTYIGPGSCGHFVKMVHNGIEYALMQIIAEAYDILRTLYNLSADETAEIFSRLNKGRLSSFLFEITEQVLRKKDSETGKALVDLILDEAEQKGTGNWMAADSLKRGIAIPVIAEAVYARTVSGEKELRQELENIYGSPGKTDLLPLEQFFPILENGLIFSNIIAYCEGYEMIMATSRKEKWDINPAEIARIWQGGCIIRAEILKEFQKDLGSSPSLNLLAGKDISKITKETIADLKKLVSIFTENGIPAPCISSSLNYYATITRSHGPAGIIQALRDNFGSHTYKRIDKEGTFHTEWDK